MGQQKRLKFVIAREFYIIFLSYYRMRSHFAQTLPVPKREDDITHPISSQLRKTNTSPQQKPSNKTSFYEDLSIIKKQTNQSFKTQGTISEQETPQPQINSFRSIEKSNQVRKFNPFRPKEKKSQTHQVQQSHQASESPSHLNSLQQSNQLKQTKTAKEIPQALTTLKTLLQSKGLASCDKSFKKEQNRVQLSQMNFNNSLSVSRCMAESQKSARKSMNLLKQQNEILRQENELLKNQLGEIKRNLLSLNSFKKEETISNLRDTIKKQDNQIRQLRLKLEISNNKTHTLNTLIENKDEEIDFLNAKISQLKSQILEMKQKVSRTMQNLQEKMVMIVEGYTQLQQKFKAQQLEWLAFTEKWKQEKSMYTHRISFLQAYISNNI